MAICVHDTPYRSAPIHGTFPGHTTETGHMARAIRFAKLETRTTRLKLAVQRKPYFVTIAPGISLGYRRNAGSGSWVVRAANTNRGNPTKAFAHADDHEDASGDGILDYWAAQDRARAVARGDTTDAGRPVSVAEALDQYAADL